MLLFLKLTCLRYNVDNLVFYIAKLGIIAQGHNASSTFINACLEPPQLPS